MYWKPLQTSFAAASALAIGLGVAGCADSSTGTPSQQLSPPTASADAVKFWESGASVHWNALLRDLIAAKSTKPNQQANLRGFTYLSLAQYDAVIAAEDGTHGSAHPSTRGAVAGASAVVLEYLFPADAAAFEAEVQAQRVAPRSPGEAHTEFGAGETIGRAIGAAVVASAQTDRFNAVWTGTVPTGPGLWFSSAVPPAPPLLPLLGQMRPFFMTSGDQFRPGPPPAFGSPAYLRALAEIRKFSDTRTPEQLAIAQFWAGTTGSLVAGFWNAEIAADVVSSSPRRAAGGARLRAREHGSDGRQHRLPRHEVHLLADPAVAGRPRDHDADRAAQPSVVCVEPRVRLGNRRLRARRALSRPGDAAGGDGRRSCRIAALRRNPLSVRQGGGTDVSLAESPIWRSRRTSTGMRRSRCAERFETGPPGSAGQLPPGPRHGPPLTGVS